MTPPPPPPRVRQSQVVRSSDDSFFSGLVLIPPSFTLMMLATICGAGRGEARLLPKSDETLIAWARAPHSNDGNNAPLLHTFDSGWFFCETNLLAIVIDTVGSRTPQHISCRVGRRYDGLGGSGSILLLKRWLCKFDFVTHRAQQAERS